MNSKESLDFSSKALLHKIENLNEMDNFLDIYQLSQLNLSELNNLNRPLGHKEIESVIKNVANITKQTKKHTKKHTHQKTHVHMVLTAEFYQIFNEELIPIIL
jgi:methionine synthase II (cobalamin-independent)